LKENKFLLALLLKAPGLLEPFKQGRSKLRGPQAGIQPASVFQLKDNACLNFRGLDNFLKCKRPFNAYVGDGGVLAVKVEKSPL